MKKMSGVSEAYTYNIEYFSIIFPFLFIFLLYIEFVALCYVLQYGPEETCSGLYGGMTIKKISCIFDHIFMSEQFLQFVQLSH